MRRRPFLSTMRKPRTGLVRELVYLRRRVDELEKIETACKLNEGALRRAMEGTIQAMEMTVELRDPYTAGHQQRVAHLACSIADAMGLSKTCIEGINMAAVIHDIGKIYVPAEILSKPGRLNDFEYIIIKAHPEVGHNILKSVDFPWPIARMVFQHHERMDGSGYPCGIRGDEILLESRILAVADIVESMASHRPYRPAVGIDKACEEITCNRDTLYDCDVVDACNHLIQSGEFCFDRP